MTQATCGVEGARQHQYEPEIPGSYKWVSDQPRKMLEAGMTEGIRITSHTKRGPVVQYYYFQPQFVDGRLKSVEFRRELDDGENCVTYTVDCTFGPHYAHWTCSCRDWEHRGRWRRIVQCKHTRCAYRALVDLGMIPEATP